MRRMWLAAALAIALMAPGQANAQAQGSMMHTSNPAELPKVFAVQLRVADLDRSERFYHDVFGARVVRVHDRERAAQFTSGVGIILVQGEPPAADASPAQGAGGILIEVADLQAVLQQVEAAGGVVIHHAPAAEAAQNPAANPPQDAAAQAIAAGLRAAMIRDPDGVVIEVIQFPSAP